MKYQHILCALDLNEDNITVAIRAAELARHDKARLSLIHVVEFFPIDPANELVLPQQQQIEEQLVARSKEVIARVAGELGIEDVSENVVSGSTKSEIISFAKDHEVDLIVIGNHGRHGISRLLGSTANAVLHHAPCDVLTVHIDG
ncbi:universal stress protein [Kaarinaea lacus]